MPASSSPETRLRIDAADAATEIFVIDASLRRIARAVGSYVGHLPPGLYKLRLRAANTQHDQLLEMGTEVISEIGTEVISLRAAPVPFRATLPLADTLGFRAEQAEAARRISRAPARRLGTGGELFLFVRETDPGWPMTLPSLALYSLQGTRLARFELRDLVPGAGCAGIRLTLDPGAYALRIEGEEPVEMFLSVCPGWQTRAWLLMDECWRDRQCLRGASLGSAVLSMARSGVPFDADDPRERLGELACHALRQGRDVVSPALWRAAFQDEHACPMLGLYAAHMLLARRRPEEDRIRTVLGELRGLIGEQGDLVALETALDPDRRRPRPGGKPLPDMPPSLTRGWRLLVRASRRRRGLIEAGSLLSCIGEDVIQGEPWLLHRVAVGGVAGRSAVGSTQSALPEDSIQPSTAMGAIAPRPAVGANEPRPAMGPAEPSLAERPTLGRRAFGSDRAQPSVGKVSLGLALYLLQGIAAMDGPTLERAARALDDTPTSSALEARILRLLVALAEAAALRRAWIARGGVGLLLPRDSETDIARRIFHEIEAPPASIAAAVVRLAARLGLSHGPDL